MNWVTGFLTLPRALPTKWQRIYCRMSRSWNSRKKSWKWRTSSNLSLVLFLDPRSSVRWCCKVLRCLNDFACLKLIKSSSPSSFHAPGATAEKWISKSFYFFSWQLTTGYLWTPFDRTLLVRHSPLFVFHDSIGVASSLFFFRLVKCLNDNFPRRWFFCLSFGERFLHLRRGNLHIDRNTRKVVPRDADELANLCKLIFRRLESILQPILRSSWSWIERISQSMKKVIFHALVSAPPGLRWHRWCLLIAAVIYHQLQVEVTPHASQSSREMNDARHKFSFTTSTESQRRFDWLWSGKHSKVQFSTSRIIKKLRRLKTPISKTRRLPLSSSWSINFNFTVQTPFCLFRAIWCRRMRFHLAWSKNRRRFSA